VNTDELDCQSCAACCRHAFERVTISPQERLIELHPRLVRHCDGFFELTRSPEGCAALEQVDTGEADGDRYSCSVYDDRPRSCREFERGSRRCLEARERIGIGV
jgi:Fe-S-cluster containining protein